MTQDRFARDLATDISKGRRPLDRLRPSILSVSEFREGREEPPEQDLIDPELFEFLQAEVSQPIATAAVTEQRFIPSGEEIPREEPTIEFSSEDVREWWQFWKDKPLRGEEVSDAPPQLETLFGRTLSPREQQILSPSGIVTAGMFALGMTRLGVGEIGRVLAPIWRASLTRNLRSWVKSLGKDAPVISKETERVFVAAAAENIPESLLAKETFKTFFRPTKAGIKLTAEGIKATEKAAGEAVAKSPLLLSASKGVVPKAPSAVTEVAPIGEVPIEGVVPSVVKPVGVKEVAPVERVTLEVTLEQQIREVYTPEKADIARVALTKIISGTYDQVIVREGGVVDEIRSLRAAGFDTARFNLPITGKLATREQFSAIVEEANVFFRALNKVEAELFPIPQRAIDLRAEADTLEQTISQGRTPSERAGIARQVRDLRKEATELEEAPPVTPVEAPPIKPPTLTTELSTTPPPITPEGEVLGRTANEFTGISMVDLQDAQTVADVAFRDDTIRRWINLLPETHAFFRTLNPSAIANTPAEKAVGIRAVLKDEAVQKSQGVNAYLAELGSQEKVFGKLNEKGELASGKFKGLTVGDIAHDFKRFAGEMTGAERDWLNRANDIENAVTDYFIRHDIDINLLSLEEGGHFATRKVWGKVVGGEVLDTRYVGTGPGRPGSKIATEKRRWFKTEADAIKEGYRYLPYDVALSMKVQGTYNRVVDKQMSDWLLTKIPWRTTGAPEELVLAAESAKLKLRHSQQLLGALNRAVRGERVPDITIGSIARSYPDQAQELKALIPLIQEGAPTAQRVQSLTNVAKGLVDTNKGNSQRAINARARAREEALKVKFEEATIPAPAFAGKILTGPEAKETSKVLTEAFDPEFSKVLASVNKANDMVRFLILAGDASPFGIQLIFLPGAHPKVAAQAVKGYVGALFSPEFLASYKTKHKATIDKHPNLILPEVGTAEMTEAMARGGWFSGKNTLLPQSESYWKNMALVIPRVAGRGASYALMPFARAYSGAMTVAGIELAEALEYMGTTPERMADLDQYINVFRGMTSSARIGVTPHWQQVEKASLLAPMYNRGIAGILFDAGTKGGIRGAEARKGLAKGIAALMAMAVLISLARGENQEEIIDHFNPNSPNFFTWSIAGQRLGPGSKVRSVVKVWAQSAKNPEALFEFSMDNPALRFIRGNLAPVISSGIDLITGRNYIGDPTRDGMLSFSREMLAGNLLPIWTQSVLLEGGDLTGRVTRGITEFFGGRAYPEPLWNEVGRLRDKYSETDFNVKYKELNREQVDKLRRSHPDLDDLEEKAKLEGSERGTEFEKWLFETREQIVTERNDSLEKAAYALSQGLISKWDYEKERKYARPYYSGGIAVLWSARETLTPYAVRQIEKWMGENQKPEDKALDKYLEYRGNLIARAELPKDWDRIEGLSERFLLNFSPSIRSYVKTNRNRWIEALPYYARTVELWRLEGIENETYWDNFRDVKQPLRGGVPPRGRIPSVSEFRRGR